ncbi:MAG: hypothetical protein HC803_12080 [Saprospiraceae bacterium]|nr:hypothetical protein [Saprospiraceae bacterium]
MLEIIWQDTLQPRFINYDTVLTLNFANVSACLTPLTWNTNASTINYRGNQLLNTTQYQDATLEFLTTDAPILLSPFDNETDVEPTADFQWQIVDCSVHYQFQIATDANFTNLILDSLNLINPFLNNISLQHTTTYFWRVGRYNSQNDSYWSDTLQFTTINLPTISVRIGDTLTYSDTLSVPITLENLIKIQSFELVLEYDENAMQFLNFSDTIF